LWRSSRLEADFPNLAAAGYELTSPCANPPTCIGYALGDFDYIWDANGAVIKEPGYKWLPDGPFDFQIDTVAKIFELHGYTRCRLDDSLEEGYEKIAIYEDKRENREEPFSHVARQLPNGKWTSKLGPDEDIEHDTLAALEGNTWVHQKSYGRVVRIMKRRVR
jgi:hypothetical protein